MRNRLKQILFGVGGAALLVATVLFPYLSFQYAKIESNIITLIICSEAFESKSGSSLHDAKIAVIFNSNLACLKDRRSTFLGEMIFSTALKSNELRERSFSDIMSKYL